MKLQSTLIVSLVAAVSAVDVSSNTKADLVSKSRDLNNNNYQNDFTWMANYDLRFDSCHSILSFGGEEAQRNAEYGGSPEGVQHLVKYSLCKANGKSTCGSCSATYMVDLRDFAETYVQAQEEMKEANCQAVEENCNCNYYYGDDQACMNNCYRKAGLDYCLKNNGEDFDPTQYLECVEAPFNNNNNKYYNAQSYFIGPKCARNGKSIHLAVFTDASCTVEAPSNTYEKHMYGYTLPYSKEALISKNCVSCKNQDNNNNNKYYYQRYYEASETCTQLYQASAKCEKNFAAKNQYTKNTKSCDFIHKVVPALEKVYHRHGSGVAGGLAFFFFLTTVGVSILAAFLYSKVKRSTVNLSSKGGSVV